uniref:Uncharacterized protein n=1 Tax=viral metagenome TaxID=1070528 RepID=A0A6C0BP33_9ZZZZ
MLELTYNYSHILTLYDNPKNLNVITPELMTPSFSQPIKVLTMTAKGIILDM